MAVAVCLTALTASQGFCQTIVGNPSATQTINQPTNTRLNVNRIEGVIFADQFSGADMGAQIATAISTLGSPPNGIVDARGFGTGSTISAFTIPRGVTVNLPCGLFTVVGTITMNEGSSLTGCQTVTDVPPIAGNKNGTVLKASSTLSGDVLRLEALGSTNCNPSFWAHNTKLSFVSVYGNGAAGSGNGITICQQGENSSIHDVSAFNAPQDGFSFVGNNAGEHLNYNLEATSNGRYGFSFNSLENSQTISGAGGDDNTSSLIYYNGVNGSTLTLIGLKSESFNSVSHQDPVILMSPTSFSAFTPSSLHILGGYANGVSGHSDAIRVINSNASIEIESWPVPSSQYANLVNDTVNAQVVTTVNSNSYSHVIYSGGGKALLVVGDVNVTGQITKSSGSFKIDHPIEPSTKFLSHSFVESPDMMNIYNGLATLDKRGEVWIDLPSYFEALNRDFRYQLTSIGTSEPNLYVAKTVSENRFKIAGGRPGGQISWQVTGVRHDAYAEAHRIPVEQEKDPTDRGHYMHPELFKNEVAPKITKNTNQN
jgi:hypothetical protein